MSFADISIRRKLMVIVLSTSGLVLLLTSIAFISYEWITFRNGMRDSMTTLAKVIADNTTAALAFRSPSDAREVLNALKAENSVDAAVLYDQNGKVFAFYPDNLASAMIPEKPGPDGATFLKTHLVIFQPVVQSRERYGTLYLRASLSVITRSIKNFARIGALIFLVSFLSAFLLTTILQRAISNPILMLANAAESVTENRDYAVRVEKSGEDELGALTETFNEMLGKIEQSDAGLRRAIGEKDVLIQEVHHRVKNNLQVILSLFDMQARTVKSQDALAVFQDCKTRIRSMSLVHELLYGASDLSKIDYREYVTKLTQDLATSYNHSSRSIKTNIDLENVELDINKAVPLGLLTNEVLTNSLKHAFDHKKDPEIFIKQVPADHLKIVIGDNGKGLPGGVDTENPKSFGLRIIRLLAEQLNAKLSVQSNPGLVYTLDFKS